jgi:hypothetical protein
MKMILNIAAILILAGLLGSSARAQSNCCNIQPAGTQISSTEVNVPGPNGGTYISTETQTIPIACWNTSTQKACSNASVPPNVVTAVGSGAWVAALGRFVACNPSFTPGVIVNQTDSTPATFTHAGISWSGPDAAGNCTQISFPSAQSQCVIVQCGNSPVDPNPACSLGCKPGEYREQTNCTCVPDSPVLLDISGEGFILTNAANGVVFDISGTGSLVQMGWTAKGADNAFLALPGPDGLIHNGKELFGNFTPQPRSNTPNGFAALAVYDDPENGGNGDGIIDERDAVFKSLRLWIDANHDGVSQPEEIYTLSALGVSSISLNYKEDHKTDQYGNQFRYRTAVNPGHPDKVGRVAYDVFFVITTSSASARRCFVPERAAHNDKSNNLTVQK